AEQQARCHARPPNKIVLAARARRRAVVVSVKRLSQVGRTAQTALSAPSFDRFGTFVLTPCACRFDRPTFPQRRAIPALSPPTADRMARARDQRPCRCSPRSPAERHG